MELIPDNTRQYEEDKCRAFEEAMKYVKNDECIVLWNDEWQQQSLDNMPTNYKKERPERVEPVNGYMHAEDGHWIVMIDDEETWMSLPHASLVLLTTEQLSVLESVEGRWDGGCVEFIGLTEELANKILEGENKNLIEEVKVMTN